jgi:hypothetical protein
MPRRVRNVSNGTTYRRKKIKNDQSHSHYQLLNTRHPQSNVVRLRSTRQELDMESQSGWTIASVHSYLFILPKSEFIHFIKFSEKHKPRVSTISWSTTGLDRVSQFKASNRGLILRSRSSTSRFWLACYKRPISIVYN